MRNSYFRATLSHTDKDRKDLPELCLICTRSGLSLDSLKLILLDEGYRVSDLITRSSDEWLAHMYFYGEENVPYQLIMYNGSDLRVR